MSRTRRLLAVVPFVLVFGILGFAVWTSRGAEADRLGVEADDLTTQLAVQHSRLERGEAFAAGGDSSEVALESSRVAVPADGDVGSFVTANEEAAAAVGVQVLTVVPEPPSELEEAELPDDLSRVGLDVTVRGAEEAVVAYLDALAALPRLTVVENVAITAEGSGSASAALRVALFHRGPPEGEPAG